ncbi:hypothetical protein MHU86_1570 [Fragilaria crotonensis]|nr:hypothetical protein MHU86_1570 [Fragilaria crotonensis]
MPWIAELKVLTVFICLLHHACEAWMAVRHVNRRWSSSPSRFLISPQKIQQSVDLGIDHDTNQDDNGDGDHDGDEEEYLYSVLNTALVQAQTLMKMDYREELPPKLQQLFHYCRKAVETRQSTISNAGRGLFASIDIPAGTVVSFYPIHAVGANYWKGHYCIGATDPDDQEHFETVHHSDYLLNLIGDRIFPGGQRLVETFAVQPYIDTNPNNNNNNRPDQPGWMAHLVNDCATITRVPQLLVDARHGNAETTAVVEYYNKVVKGQNCVLVPFGSAPMCAAVTTRDVIQGEELFVGYGYGYWSERLSDTTSSPISEHEKETQWTTSETHNQTLLSLENTLFDEMMAIVALVKERYADEAKEMDSIFQTVG